MNKYTEYIFEFGDLKRGTRKRLFSCINSIIEHIKKPNMSITDNPGIRGYVPQWFGLSDRKGRVIFEGYFSYRKYDDKKDYYCRFQRVKSQTNRIVYINMRGVI